MTKQVIIPLPDRDFDTTEVAIPWKHFVEAGLHVTFSTETGQIGQTDPRLLTGVIFGQLGAKPDALAAYRELEKDEAFRHPIPYESINPQQYDVLLLPGGHAKGMRQYLESKVVQNKALEFFKYNKTKWLAPSATASWYWQGQSILTREEACCMGESSPG